MTARPGHYGASPRKLKPAALGPFEAWLTAGICKRAEAVAVVRRMAAKAVQPETAWEALRAAATERPRVYVTRDGKGGYWHTIKPSSAAIREALQADAPMRKAMQDMHRAADKLLALAEQDPMFDAPRPELPEFAEAAHSVTPAEAPQVGVRARWVFIKGLRDAVATVKRLVPLGDIDVKTTPGRQEEPFSEAGPAAAALERLGLGVKLRGRLLGWARVAQARGL